LQQGELRVVGQFRIEECVDSGCERKQVALGSRKDRWEYAGVRQIRGTHAHQFPAGEGAEVAGDRVDDGVDRLLG
jgi:hypothetical protein